MRLNRTGQWWARDSGSGKRRFWCRCRPILSSSLSITYCAILSNDHGQFALEFLAFDERGGLRRGESESVARFIVDEADLELDLWCALLAGEERCWRRWVSVMEVIRAGQTYRPLLSVGR